MMLALLTNAAGGEIYVNPERVTLLEPGEQRSTTKIWLQRSDDEAYGGNCVIADGELHVIARELTNYS